MKRKSNNKEPNYQKEESNEYHSYQTMNGESTYIQNYKNTNLEEIGPEDMYVRSMTESNTQNDKIQIDSLQNFSKKKTGNRPYTNNLNNLKFKNDAYTNSENDIIKNDKDNKIKMRLELEKDMNNGNINNNYFNKLNQHMQSNRKEFITKCSDTLNNNKKFIQKINNIRNKIIIINILSCVLFFLNLVLFLNDDLEDYKILLLSSLILISVFLLLNILLIISIFLKILSNIYYANIFRFFSIIDFALSLADLIVYIISTNKIISEIIDDKNINKILVIVLFILILIINVPIIFITGLLSSESLLIAIGCKNEFALELLGYSKTKKINNNQNYIILEEETNDNSNSLKKFHACLH